MSNGARRRIEPDFPRPLVTVDTVILTVRGEGLEVLLTRRPEESNDPFPGMWALPGGFVDVRRDASLEACARRKLEEKTGVATPYLEQVGSWGNSSRDPRGWSTTHVYVALLGPGVLPAVPAGGTAAAWVPLRGRSAGRPLAFDHAELLAAAIDRVRAKAEYTSLPVHLLPREFTLTELQRVFEIVLDRPLEKKAFRTRMLARDLLEPAGEWRETTRRPARLYRARRSAGITYFARSFEPGRR